MKTLFGKPFDEKVKKALENKGVFDSVKELKHTIENLAEKVDELEKVVHFSDLKGAELLKSITAKSDEVRLVFDTLYSRSEHVSEHVEDWSEELEQIDLTEEQKGYILKALFYPRQNFTPQEWDRMNETIRVGLLW